MATIRQPLAGATTREIPQKRVRFDRFVIIFVCWFVIGLFIDGWAHNHGLVDKTFFTPFSIQDMRRMPFSCLTHWCEITHEDSAGERPYLMATSYHSWV
jgi:hypothetical protein